MAYLSLCAPNHTADEKVVRSSYESVPDQELRRRRRRTQHLAGKEKEDGGHTGSADSFGLDILPNRPCFYRNNVKETLKIKKKKKKRIRKKGTSKERRK